MDGKWTIQSPAVCVYLEGRDDPGASVALLTKDYMVR